jgi:hypothetical protein
MMDSSTSRARAGYTMVPKDDTLIDASTPFDGSNGDDDNHRAQELGEVQMKDRKILNRDR